MLLVLLVYLCAMSVILLFCWYSSGQLLDPSASVCSTPVHTHTTLQAGSRVWSVGTRRVKVSLTGTVLVCTKVKLLNLSVDCLRISSLICVAVCVWLCGWVGDQTSNLHVINEAKNKLVARLFVYSTVLIPEFEFRC
jgi:hypothetical protein